MKTILFLSALSALLGAADLAAAQQPESGQQAPAVPNPFENTAAMPGADMYGSAGMAAGPSGMGGEMGGYGSMMGGYGAVPADPFRSGLALLLKQLANAETDAERDQLMKYAREAFTGRYKQQLTERERRIRDLEKRLAALREEQKRRAEATDRIVDLQMQSLELVAEGLLDANQFLNLGPGAYGGTNGAEYGSGGSMYPGGGMYGGTRVSRPHEGGSGYGGSPPTYESAPSQPSTEESDEE